MPVVKVDLTPTAYERLAHLAVRERRPIPWQAEHLIERAVRRVEIPPRAATPADLPATIVVVMEAPDGRV